MKMKANKSITTFAKVKGKKFKVVSNTGHHNYPLNVTLTFKRNYNSTQGMDMAEEVPGGNTIYAMDCILVTSTTKAEIQAEVKELKKEYKDKLEVLETYLSYLEESGAESVDDDEIRVYKALKALSSDASDYEKAKVIATIINKQ